MPKGNSFDPTLAGQLALLRQTIEHLADEVRVLRDALDEASDHFTWAAQNDKLGCRPPLTVLTSMPLDPLSPNWQLNRLSAADVPAGPAASRRTSLFD